MQFTHRRLLVYIALFFLVSIGVVFHVFTRVDLMVLSWIQSSVPDSLDRLLSVFSLIGSFEVLTFFLFIFLFPKDRALFFRVFAVYLMGLGIEIFMKYFLFT